MEQIEIRQPKMLAAQSFIQILRTFLAILSSSTNVLFSYIKRIYVSGERLNPLVILDLSSNKLRKEKISKGNKVKNLNYLL